MKYLLDTHVIIWYLEDSSELPPEIKDIIDNPDNDIYICSISLWEIVIKMNIGKLKLGFGLDELLINIKNSDFIIVQLEDEYLKCYFGLPLLHRDPFDRLLISTAIAENLIIVTADENIHKYNAQWLWKTK